MTGHERAAELAAAVAVESAGLELAAAVAVKAGEPYRVDKAAAVRLAGIRDQVHPADVTAHVYRTKEGAGAWTVANAAYGLPALATVPTEMGIMVVFDLRPSLRAAGAAITDPARPDSHDPGLRYLAGPR